MQEEALRQRLTRTVAKGKIVSIYKGYYLIITPQYSARGILPPVLFIDGLMHYIRRPYYVSLLNAASFFGAAHQQPQEFFVCIGLPALRPTIRKKLKINYISKTDIIQDFLETRKTETGAVLISNPALTAVDLVHFDQRIGGLNRAATVLVELAEAIQPEQITGAFLKTLPVSAIQRLGFILEVILQQDIARHLYEVCQQESLEFFRVPLKKSGTKKGFQSNERWKVIINTKIESDQ